MRIKLSQQELSAYRETREVHGQDFGNLSDEQIMAWVLWLHSNAGLPDFIEFYKPRELFPLPSVLVDES